MADAQLTETEATRWSHVGALAAVACALGYLETFLPIPIPGVKLGLANIAVLVALAEGDVVGAVWVALVKVAAMGLLFGSPITLVYSLAGTLLSLAVMLPLSRLRTMRLWMTSVMGALAHEAGQLLVAQVLLGTTLVWWSAPALTLAGCFCGLFCGLIAERTVSLLERADSTASHSSMPGPLPSRASLTKGRTLVDGRWAFGLLLVFWVGVLCSRSLAVTATAALGSAILCVALHVHLRAALRMLVPVVPLCAVTLVAQLLASPSVQEAIASAAISSARLVAIVLSSLAFTHTQTTDSLLGLAHWLTKPFKAAGLSLAGPSRALEVTLRLLPKLATIVGEEAGDLGATPNIKGMLEVLPRSIVRTVRAAETLA